MRISDWSSDVCSSNLVAPDDVDQRHRGVDHGVHRLEPALSCEIVGILPVGRRSEAQALPGLHDGKRTHGSAYSSLPAGLVAIEAPRRPVDALPRKQELVLGGRGAVRRARSVAPHTVHTETY